VPKGARVMILLQVPRGDKFNGAVTSSSKQREMIDASLARYVGGVRAYSSTPGSVDTYGSLSVGTVNFGVVANDGCGVGSAQCERHMCVTPAFVGFSVASGPCQTTDGGKCVQSPNYPKNYGRNERCEILPPSEAFSAQWFDTESGYDYLTVHGKVFQGRRRRHSTSSGSHTTVGPKSVSSSRPIIWVSDFIVTKKGFRICVDSALSLAEEREAADESDTQPENADDEDDGGSPEERRKAAEEEEAERRLEEEDRRELAALE